MESHMWKLWREELAVVLPELSDVDAGDSPVSLEGKLPVLHRTCMLANVVARYLTTLAVELDISHPSDL